MKINKKFIALAALVLIAITVTTGIIIYNNSPAVRLRKQLDLGNKYLNELDYKRAVAEFTKAVSIKPDSEEAKEKLALAYIDWGQSCVDEKDYEKAADIYAEAYSALPENDEIKKSLVQAYFDCADMLTKAKEYEKAIGILDREFEILSSETVIDRIVKIYIEWSDDFAEKEDFDNAMRIINAGYDKTKDEQLHRKLDEIIYKMKYYGLKKYSTLTKVFGGNREGIAQLMYISFENYRSSTEEYAELLEEYAEYLLNNDMTDIMNLPEGQLLEYGNQYYYGMQNVYSILNEYYLNINDMENAKRTHSKLLECLHKDKYITDNEWDYCEYDEYGRFTYRESSLSQIEERLYDGNSVYPSKIIITDNTKHFDEYTYENGRVIEVKQYDAGSPLTVFIYYEYEGNIVHFYNALYNSGIAEYEREYGGYFTIDEFGYPKE